MRHFTATRFHLPIHGVSHERAPYTCPRVRALLVALIVYSAGFFTGAILFGEMLLTLHR